MKTVNWQQLALDVSYQTAPDMEILRQRGEDVLIARAKTEDGGTAIVKCWNRRGPRGTLRRLSKSNIGWREYTALLRLHRAGIPCPEPYAYLRLPHNRARHTEALISHDLGHCADATEYYKKLRINTPEAVQTFETYLINSTVTMIQQGLLDPDHRLPNFVIPSDRIPVRIDFELCIPVRNVASHPRLLGQMIGTFLGSVVFALQPNTEAATHFSQKLFKQVLLPPKAKEIAAQTIQEMLTRQRDEAGIDTRFTLPESSV